MADQGVATAKARVISDLQELRNQAAEKLQAAEELQSVVDARGGNWTEEEEEAHGQLLAEAAELQQEYGAQLQQSRNVAMRGATAAMRNLFNAQPTPQDVLTKGALSRVTHMHVNWTNDPQWGFKGHGEYALAVYNATISHVVEPRLQEVLKYQAAIDQNVPQSGGFLLPPLYNTRIHTTMMGRRTNLMAMCDLYPMTGHLTLEMPANAETSRVAGSRWGGITSTWVEDGNAMTASEPKQRLLELRPRQLATFIRVNNTMLESPISLEAYLDKAAVDDQIQTINNAILRGDGVAKPKGFLTGSAGGSYVSIAKESAQAAASIVDLNVHKMWARVLDEESAVWLVNRDAVPALEALAATGVTGTIPIMLANVNGAPTMAIAGPQTLKGRPVLRLEQCSTIGTAGDLILANMMGYAVGYRTRGDSAGTADGEPGITRDVSMHLYFDRNQTAMRYSIALDGEAWLSTAITPENGTSTLSDFIVIDVRA